MFLIDHIPIRNLESVINNLVFFGMCRKETGSDFRFSNNLVNIRRGLTD